MDQITQNLNKNSLRCFEINSPKENFKLFGSNYIKTTKYTLYSFLPLSLLNQYKRLANVYFLALSILGLIPSISPWTPITQILPTVFVLAVAIIREAIEDYYRYKSDSESNKQPVMKVMNDGTLIEIKSSQIMVGDIIWVPDEIEIPADILIIGGGNVQQIGGQVECFVHTSSLDGEKNLKKKAAPKGLRVENDIFLLKKQLSVQELFPILEGSILCDLPNKDLLQFHGVLSLEKVNQFEIKTTDPEQIDIYDKQVTQYILSENNILLKGTKLMNTPKGIIGIVTYSGLDTKLLQNQNKGRYKQSGVEIETNKIVMGMLIFTILASLVLAYLEFRQIQQNGDPSYYLYQINLPSKNALYQFIVTFLSNICLNSTFIPISLLVAIECSKVVQAYFIISDVELITLEYDEQDQEVEQHIQNNNDLANTKQDNINKVENQRLPKHMQGCTVQTCSLNEELGQVRFIFSDKTGTLTRNMMEFRLCKIGKQIYGDQSSLFENSNDNQNYDQSHNKSMQSGRSIDIEQQSQRSNMSRASQASKRSTTNHKQKVSYQYKNVQLEEILFEGTNKNTPKLNIQMISDNGKVKFQFSNQKILVNEFLKCLSITHECMANKVKSKIESQNDQITYQGTSPDEVALIEFAQKHGYEFISGTDEHIKVQKNIKSLQNMHFDQIGINGNQNIWMNDTILDFQLLRKMEFNSDRKRMSILVKDVSDGFYKLYTKGADNIIKERLNQCYFDGSNSSNRSSDKLKINKSQIEISPENQKSNKECKHNLEQTNQFLFQASVQGYRTLLVGMKILDEEEVNIFLEECNTAEKDIKSRNKNLDEVYDRLEQGLYLIGATVVEDRLQDQVPETIQALHQANIKIWVLTGDKLETAESIGFSSKLLTFDMDILRCRDSEDVKELFNEDQAQENEQFLLKGKKRALVIESIALKILLESKNFEIKRWFLKISRTMETVICCRVSPSQKADVVRMIKQDDPEIITLAIGDGANDVPMILEADIGVGLYGKEGMRAVDTSDYAVAEFRHLWTLLFKWGRWNYTRQTLNINYYFYKNFAYTLFQILFQQSNFYSSQPIFPDTFLSLFNMMFTAWPVACYSINELDIYPKSYDQDTIDQQYKNDKTAYYKQDPLTSIQALDPAYIRQFIPNIYFPGQRNLMFNSWIFFCWIFIGLVECFVIYLITYVVYSNGHVLNKRGETGDLWTFGMTIFTSLLYVVTNKLQLRIMKYDCFMVNTIFFLTYVFYYLFIYITDNWYLSVQSSFTFMILYEMPIFYITVFLCISICFIIDFLIENVTQIFMKDARDLLKYQVIKNNSELTKEFLQEFDKLVKIESSIQRIEDQLKEQELSLIRIIKSNQSQEELLNEKKNNGVILKMNKNKQIADSSNIIGLKIIRLFYSFILRYTNLIPLNTNIVDNQQLKYEEKYDDKEKPIIRKTEKELIIQDEDRIAEQQLKSPTLTQFKKKLSHTLGSNKVQDQNTVTHITQNRMTVVEPVTQKQINSNPHIHLDFPAKSRIYESQQKLPMYLQVEDLKSKASKENDNMLNNRLFSQQIELKQLNDSNSINSLQEKSSIQIDLHDQIRQSEQNQSNKQKQLASDYE